MATAQGRNGLLRGVDWAGPLLWSIPGGLLGLSSRLGVLFALGAIAAGGIGSILLASPRLGLGPALPVVPGVVSLGLVAATSPANPVSYALGGAAGLLVVLALARNAAERSRRGRVTAAVLVPALGVGIALSTSLLFPASERFVGIAGLLLLAVVVGVALVLRRPGSVLEAEGGTS